MVLNIEQKHGIRQVYLLTFDWYFLGHLSHSFKTLSQGNIPVLLRATHQLMSYSSLINWSLFFLINNLQLICNRFSTIFKSCIRTRTMQLSVFVANNQHRGLGTFPYQQMKMVPKEGIKYKYFFCFFQKCTLIMTTSAKTKNCTLFYHNNNVFKFCCPGAPFKGAPFFSGNINEKYVYLYFTCSITINLRQLSSCRIQYPTLTFFISYYTFLLQ